MKIRLEQCGDSTGEFEQWQLVVLPEDDLDAFELGSLHHHATANLKLPGVSKISEGNPQKPINVMIGFRLEPKFPTPNLVARAPAMVQFLRDEMEKLKGQMHDHTGDRGPRDSNWQSYTQKEDRLRQLLDLDGVPRTDAK